MSSLWGKSRLDKYILVIYDNNINGDIKVRKTIYIIIILILIILPGCSNSNNGDKAQTPQDLLRTEQIETFDARIFTILESVLGVHFSNYRLVTIAQESTDDEEKNNSINNSQQNQGKETAQDKDKNNTIKISEIVDDNSIFEQGNKPDWEKAKQYIRQASDIFVDIQIELQNVNVPQEEIKQYGTYISQLVHDISNEDMEKSVQDIQVIYEHLHEIFSKSTKDERILTIKKLYYDVIQLMILLEQDNEEKFNQQLQIVKEDVDNLQIHIKLDNEKYLKERIDMLIENVDYSKRSDTRLKIVMLINCIPILEYYEYE